jgi:hypothetical protein
VSRSKPLMRKLTLLCAVSPSLLVVVGCSDSRRDVAPVSGRITLDGKPLAGASVVSQPVAPPGSVIAGKGSGAFCDDDGRFQLETLDGRPGAIVGEHRIRIYGPRDPKATSDRDGGGGPRREPIPAKYNKDTQLTLTVPPDGTSEANFSLKSK